MSLEWVDRLTVEIILHSLMSICYFELKNAANGSFIEFFLF